MSAGSKAVIVLSGGLDSACAASCMRGYELYGITFSYGQKACREVKAAEAIAGLLGLKEHRTVDIGFMRDLYGSSNVLTGAGPPPERFDYAIVVPVRNAIFLSIASAWAFALGATLVAYGAHSGDEHYPDCRPAFAGAFESAMNAGEEDGIRSGMRQSIRIWSPYSQGTTKAALLRAGADRLGDALFQTWSCYLDGQNHCGRCESCRNRKAAFAAAGIADRTVYCS